MSAQVTQRRVIVSEWTKATSLGSTLWTVLSIVALAVGLAVGLAMFARPGDGSTAVSLVVSGAVLAQLGALALGVLLGTADYTTGSAATTYTAVPRRLPVLTAQVVVVAGLSVVAAAATLGATIVATAGLRERAGVAAGLSDQPGGSRALVGYVVYLAAVALLGLGAGALLRQPAGALVAGVALLLVVDQVLASNPGRLADTVRVVLPGVGIRLAHDDATVAALDAASLGPDVGVWGAGLVLAAWVVGLLALAGWRLRRDDVG